MIREFIVIALLVGSIFFFFVGTLGLIRMPDPFTRLHATTKCDTLGAGFAFLALITHFGLNVLSIKILLILIFIWVTNPTAAHVISKAVYKRRGGSIK